MKFEKTNDWAKKAAKFIIEELEKSGIQRYKAIKWLSTILIAWAPWSWKTEFVNTILDTKNFIVIDIDKYREYFIWYTWKNADEYQDCSSRVATKIFDYCIKNNLKVIFDGTLTARIWVKNIEKSKKKNRKIGIVLIYQDPLISYWFTLARQVDNKRNVSIDAFLRIYYNSIQYCFESTSQYTDIQFIVWSKNKQRVWKQFSMSDKTKFDKYFRVDYNADTLRKKLEKLHEGDNLLTLINWIWKKK